MTVEEIKKKVEESDEYKIIHTHPRLKDRIMFLCLGGSYAYGTNNENSDLDIRGVFENGPEVLSGMDIFDVFDSSETDTVIYSFMKFCRLCTKVTPSAIEFLGCRPDHYFFMSDLGRELINNKEIFLSQEVVRTFGGYATSQLRRLENNLARHHVSQEKKMEHIRASMEQATTYFEDRYKKLPQGSLKIYVDDDEFNEGMKAIYANVDLKHYPARMFNSIINDLKNVLDAYDKLNNRNKKKDDNHLNKHAMHLIRLYLTALDILERGVIKTYRDEERGMLVDIRNGKYQNEDHTYKSEFFDLVTYYSERLLAAVENTSIPVEPQFDRIKQFMMDMVYTMCNQPKYDDLLRGGKRIQLV